MAEIAIDLLIENPESKKIYDHTPPSDLVCSIKDNGVLQPIWITREYKIISGHRRVNACKNLGIKTIPYETKEYSLLLVIEANRYRDKTWNEKMNEAETVEKIIKEKAKEQQGIRVDISQNSEKSYKPIDSYKEAAKAIGVSHDTYAKAKTIKEKNPEAFQKIDTHKSTIHREYKNIVQKEKREQKINKITESNLNEIKEKFSIIYADPPWRYEYSETTSREIENQYPTMSLDKIKQLPVNEITSNDCILFLWATNPKLKEAMEVIEAWGFEYRTNMAWIKDKIGMGYYARQKHELLLIAKKGNLPVPLPENRPESAINAKRGKHSKKPDIFYEIIERMYPELSKIELFARQKREGWEFWGNEFTISKIH